MVNFIKIRNWFLMEPFAKLMKEGERSTKLKKHTLTPELNFLIDMLMKEGGEGGVPSQLCVLFLSDV